MIALKARSALYMYVHIANLCHEEPFREEHDLTDLLQVRYNDNHWSKEGFDTLR